MYSHGEDRIILEGTVLQLRGTLLLSRHKVASLVFHAVGLTGSFDSGIVYEYLP